MGNGVAFLVDILFDIIIILLGGFCVGNVIKTFRNQKYYQCGISVMLAILLITNLCERGAI